MFPKFYIKNSILVLFVCALLFVEIFWGAKAFSILLLVFGSILLAYRKNAPFYQDFLRRGQGTFLAPISAKMIGTKDVFFPSLGNSYKVCEFFMPWFAEFGLYFPLNAEVKLLQEKKLRMPLFSPKQNIADDFAELNGQLIGFNNREHGDFFIFLPQSTTGTRPRIFVRAGDRGKRSEFRVYSIWR